MLQRVSIICPVTPSLRSKLKSRKMKEIAPIINSCCRGQKLDPTIRYKCVMYIYGAWLTKSGKTVRADVHNRMSTLIDIVCQCLGIDDSLVFSLHLEKVPHHESYASVLFTPYSCPARLGASGGLSPRS